MRRSIITVALGVLLLTGCGLVNDTDNLGGGFGYPPGVTLTAPEENLVGGQTSTWTASWIGDYGQMGEDGEPPYTISWDFGGGAANIPSAPAISPATSEATWHDIEVETTYSVLVTLTDAFGLKGNAVGHVTIAPTPDSPFIFDPDVPLPGGAGEYQPFVPEPDTLYAIPIDTSVAVDQPATVLIYTGETAHPFQFMLSVGVVINGGGVLVPASTNVGALGGDNSDADGVWADITTDGGFITSDALFLPGSDHEGTIPASSVRFDFNLSPLSGTDQPSVEGELFNFQVTYSSAGEKQISFQESNGINRTYYSDLASGETRFWGNYVEGTINVTE